MLEKARGVLKENGFKVTETWFDWGNDYNWSFLSNPTIDPASKEDSETVETSIRIAESEAFEGTDGGINFALSIVKFGGEILGSLVPYNYSPQVWVPLTDDEAIETRFKEFESYDFSSIANLVNGRKT